MKEEWKQIEGSKYSVSNTGLVINNETGRLMNQRSGGTSPYLVVNLTTNGKTYKALVHRLVAKAFIPNPENKKQVNHKDKNKFNNSVENLEWTTPLENMAHHYATGGVKRNNQTYKGKFGKEHNRSLKLMCDGVVYYGLSEASRLTGIGISTIQYAVSRGKKVLGKYDFQLMP